MQKFENIPQTENNSQNKQQFSIYKNEELNKFKDEMLQYFKEREITYSKKINFYQSELQTSLKNNEQLTKLLTSNYKEIITSQATLNSRLDKLNSYDAFFAKTNDNLMSHEIHINNLETDLSKATQKYDQMFIENMTLPGFIGRCAKYKNCQIFFSDVINELQKLNTYKEKNIMDFKVYKEKVDTIAKTFNNLLKNNNESQIKYINNLNQKNISDFKNMLDITNEKIAEVRITNSKYAVELVNKTKDMKDQIQSIDKIKNEILEEYEKKIGNFESNANNLKNEFSKFKNEYNIIRKKFLELADFIKDVRFKKNLGNDTINKKDFKNIIKQLKEKNINDPSNSIKLLKNISVIENLDFNTNINIEMSKLNSQFQKVNDSIRSNSINNKRNSNKENDLIEFNTNINEGHCNRKNKKNNTTKKINNIDRKLIKEKILEKKEEANSPNKKINNKEQNDENNTNKNINGVINPHDLTFLSDSSSMSNINTLYITANPGISDKNILNNKNGNDNNINSLKLFEISDENKENKVITELSAELEQSTAKMNKLESNKKNYEEKFQNIINDIDPLKFNKTIKNNEKPSEKILYNHNKSSKLIRRNSKLESLYNNNKITDITNNSLNNNKTSTIIKIESIELLNKKNNKSKKEINECNDSNNSNLNNINEKLNIYDKKLNYLESLLNEKIKDVITQINFLKQSTILMNTNENISRNSRQITSPMSGNNSCVGSIANICNTINNYYKNKKISKNTDGIFYNSNSRNRNININNNSNNNNNQYKTENLSKIMSNKANSLKSLRKYDSFEEKITKGEKKFIKDFIERPIDINLGKNVFKGNVKFDGNIENIISSKRNLKSGVDKWVDLKVLVNNKMQKTYSSNKLNPVLMGENENSTS